MDFIGVFKAVRWTEVIGAAPTIVQGARKLWTSVRGNESDASTEASAEIGPRTTVGLPPDAVAELEAGLQTMRNDLARLREEALSSADLLRSLAEQNARLVEAVEQLRIRLRTVTWIALVLTTAVAAAWVDLLMR